MEESISRLACSDHGTKLDPAELVAAAHRAGARRPPSARRCTSCAPTTRSQRRGRMRTGIFVAPFGPLADVRVLAQVAADAEADGLGRVLRLGPRADPRLAGRRRPVDRAHRRRAGDRTHGMLGALVTPLARRRPWDLARQIAVLDRLSGGRMVLGAGLGGDGRREFSAFGEELDPKARAKLLDEVLELVVELWRGEPVDHDGAAFRLTGAEVLPTPLQQPRPPVWLACRHPNKVPLPRRALRRRVPDLRRRAARRRRGARDPRGRRRAPRRRRRASTWSSPTTPRRTPIGPPSSPRRGPPGGFRASAIAPRWTTCERPPWPDRHNGRCPLPRSSLTLPRPPPPPNVLLAPR